MTPRSYLPLSGGCIFVGICLLAWAVYSCSAPPSPTVSALDASTDIVVRDCTAGEKRELAISLHNSSGQPIHVLGLTEC